MKKGLFLLLSMTLSYLSMAQVPNSFSYQMVIRNGNNELVANTTVGIRIGLLGGNAADTVWYEEEHKVKTNLNGLAYITIGKGNMLKGAISTIDWTRGPFFIKSETDPTGGTNYSLIIVSQMLSVPYAIYAKTAEKLSTPVTESDPLFSKSIAKGITAEDTARWSKKEVYDGNSGGSGGGNGGGGVVFETDPVYNTSVAKDIRSVDTAAWNNKLNLKDTMSMMRPYLRAADTASLSNRLNQKVDLQQLNTNTLTLDGKINIADTSSMLANYRTGINDKVNISDTLNMLANYRTGINSKVNISDTTSMLLPYLRDADTTTMLANYSLGINSKITAVAASKVTGILPIANGGTNSSTQNFVDLTTVQTVAGSKSFSGSTTMQGSLTGNNSNTSTIAGFSANVNTQTGTTYTLVASDNGKIITLSNAASITLTVPSLFIGFNCMVVQFGVGKITLTASGSTVSNRSSFTKTAGINAICTLVQLGASSFISAGDMEL